MQDAHTAADAAPPLTRAAIELKKRRLGKKWTQAYLGKLVDVKQGTVARWEGGTEKPRSAQQDLLEEFLGVLRGWWLDDGEKKRFADARARGKRAAKRVRATP